MKWIINAIKSLGPAPGNSAVNSAVGRRKFRCGRIDKIRTQVYDLERIFPIYGRFSDAKSDFSPASGEIEPCRKPHNAA
jgi:hypothetical protein